MGHRQQWSSRRVGRRRHDQRLELDADADAAATEVVTYVAPAADGKVLRITVKATAATTRSSQEHAQTVPVRVEAGRGDDTVIVGARR